MNVADRFLKGHTVAAKSAWRLLVGVGVTVLTGCATPPISARVSSTLTGPAIEGEQARSGPSAPGSDLRGREPASPQGPRLDDLAVAALAIRNSPVLVAARAQMGVADAQVFAAGLLPDPQLQLTLDHPTNFAGVDAMGATLGLDAITSFFGRHGRVSRARANALRVRDEIAWTEWTTAMQARDAALRAVFLRQQVAVAQDAADQTRQRLEAYEAAVKNGYKLDATTGAEFAIAADLNSGVGDGEDVLRIGTQ